ncbi:ABC transporter permease [Lamprobacter modestohalophilus]|uniref:ABC transporter permease n=1 Tax=Lamprobacter modestohalophilus TaxID=1064514 RepID=UPI002ADEC6F6|nr:ABC transporter permease [Lamprobacter modestohalophilus]MEA1052536.1 ABC transporter permease [Lamprobacter modestohalophilus]
MSTIKFPRVFDHQILDLIFYKAFADLRAEAAKTYINYLWWVIDPILTMLIFYIVFGLIFQRDEEGFIQFLLTGLVVWTWYRQTISHACNSILSGKALMAQIHVPKIVFPTVVILTDVTKFVFVFALLILFLWFSGYSVSHSYIALILVLLTQLLLITALAYSAAALVPFLPDLRFLIDNLLHLQFFVSGLFFSAELVPEKYRGLFFLNPMASLINDYRAILLHQAWPDWGRLAFISIFAIFVITFATYIINRYDQDYPRITR